MMYKEKIVEKIKERIEELESRRKKCDMYASNRIADELIFLRPLLAMIELERKCDKCGDLASCYSLEKYLCSACHDDIWREA